MAVGVFLSRSTGASDRLSTSRPPPPTCVLRVEIYGHNTVYCFYAHIPRTLRRDPYCRDLLSNHKRIFLSLLRRVYCPRMERFINVSFIQNLSHVPGRAYNILCGTTSLGPSTLTDKNRVGKTQRTRAKNAARVYDYLDHTVGPVRAREERRDRGGCRTPLFWPRASRPLYAFMCSVHIIHDRCVGYRPT